MARPDYRKRRGPRYPWHFCTNCPDWPMSNYDTCTTPGDPFCVPCQQLERNERCS